MAAKGVRATAALRILIVEDEFLVADHLAMILEDLGYFVVGPVPTVAMALALIDGERIDGAMLDTNLDGDSSEPVAHRLKARDVPFLVCTGYGSLNLGPEILQCAPRVSKPCSSHQLAQSLSAVLAR